MFKATSRVQEKSDFKIDLVIKIVHFLYKKRYCGRITLHENHNIKVQKIVTEMKNGRTNLDNMIQNSKEPVFIFQGQQQNKSTW